LQLKCSLVVVLCRCSDLKKDDKQVVTKFSWCMRRSFGYCVDPEVDSMQLKCLLVVVAKFPWSLRRSIGYCVDPELVSVQLKCSIVVVLGRCIGLKIAALQVVKKFPWCLRRYLGY
jgi:hypothetical protein